MLTGSLNAASVSAVRSAVVGLLAAACAYPLGRVPDWEDLRPLTWVGLSAALVAASNAGATLDLPPAATAWMGRLQVAGLSLHVLAWFRYLPGWARRSAPLLRRAVWPLPVVAVLALVPGVVYGRGVSLRPVAWLGVTYHQPVVTWGGVAAWAILGGYAAWGMALVVRWGRAGAPYPWAHLACTGALFVMGLHDGAVAMGMRSPASCLLDFLCYLPVSLFGVATLRRISESATEYHHLRSGLESAVADRSRELEESRVALARAERLAALGQFSAGVAHEVNNPAAAVAANLRYLAGELAGDEREEVLHSLDDARAGVQRIVRLASQLLLAGRTASGATRRLSAVSLAKVIEPAMASARARAGSHAALSVELPPRIWVKAHQEPLVQVLTNLVVNAVQAIPASRPGEVVVRAEVRGERVQLVVEDDGVGMSEDELRHVFEPFYSTKRPGIGDRARAGGGAWPGEGHAGGAPLREHRWHWHPGHPGARPGGRARRARRGGTHPAARAARSHPGDRRRRAGAAVDGPAAGEQARGPGRARRPGGPRGGGGPAAGPGAVRRDDSGRGRRAVLGRAAPSRAGLRGPGGLHNRRCRHPRGARVPAPAASPDPDEALRPLGRG